MTSKQLDGFNNGEITGSRGSYPIIRKEIMKKQTTSIIAALILGILILPTKAADDKSQYNLFNPTPKELMRPLATDRPDKTESPITVDAGHFQIETDFVNAAFNRDNRNGRNFRSRGASFALSNLKVGLTNSSDLQLVIESFNIANTKNLNTGITEEASGFGDITTRFKQNIFGNDDGKAALAVMPFIKFPTNQNNLGNNDIEGGIIIPFGYDIGHGFSLGLMTQLNIIRNDQDNGYQAETFNTATVSRGLTDNLSMFMELAMATRFQSNSDWPMTYDIGMTYVIGENIQLDAGAFIGLTDSADDFNPFVGITYRY